MVFALLLSQWRVLCKHGLGIVYIMTVFSDNEDRLAIFISSAIHGWNAHKIHGIGIRNGLVSKLETECE